jgi:PPP family 3-phenylpropionic acid transporter
MDVTDQTGAAALTLRYGAIQGFYWMANSALMGFASAYLLSVGFQSGQIGVIVAVAAALSTVLQPMAASYADRKGGSALRSVTAAFTVMALALEVFLTALHGRSMLATGVLFALAGAVVQTGTGLINSLGVSREEIRFGVSRSMGSVSYAVTSAVLGYAVAAWGTGALPGIAAALEAILLIVVLRFPAGRASTETVGQRGGFFQRNPRFFRLMAACFCVYVSHVLINNYLYQIIVSLGGDSREMGLAIALACCAEMVAMLLFSRLRTKAGCHFWLKVSTVGFTAKSLLTLLAPNIATLYLVQLLQMPAWGLIAVASVAYVYETVAPEDQARGQSYLTAAYALAMVFGCLVGGVLIDCAGVSAMLLAATAVSAVGMVILVTEKGDDHGQSR